MTDLIAYPYPIGAHVLFVDCYGANRREGEVISAPGPYTVRVRVVSGTVYWVSAGLIIGRAEADEISSTSHEGPKISRSPVPPGQLSLF